ncbi:MAG: hypothetical protein ABJD97_07085 [Betaproteobacteria bacterium]
MGDFKQDVVANWATQTPDQRFAAVKALQEKQFTAFGIPTSSVSRSTDPALGFDDPVTMFGQANAGPWNMTFNGNLFTSPTLSPTDQTELAKTMMHEGRHIESTTRRRNTGRRKGRPQPTSARSTRPPTSPSGCRRT